MVAVATTTTFSTLGSLKGTNHLRYGVATVDINETATLAIPNEGRAVVRIGVPTITSGTLTFTVVPYIGATARTLKDSSGNTVTVASSTGGFVVNIPELSGCYSFTIVCGASQGAARSFDVQMVGLDPVPSGSNEITVEAGTITANQGAPNAGGALAWPVGANGYDGTDNQRVRVANSSDAVNTTYANTGIQKAYLVLQDASTGNVSNPTNMRLGDGATGHGIQASGAYWENAAGTFDRMRTNLISTIAASAARTSTLTVADQTNYNGAMLHAVIVVTVMASGGLTPVINGKGNLGTYYALLTGAKIVGAGTTVLKIGPGFATAVNASAADMLPRTWNMVVTPDDATSITYSIEGNINE